MKRIGNIYAKICTLDNLKEAHKNARKDKLYYKEVQMVDKDPDFYLGQILELLKNGTYKVSDYKCSIISDKGKDRLLMKLPYFPDRIIQWAIMLQIEHILLNTFTSFTCASIPYRGIKRAHELTTKYMRNDPDGTKYAFKMDVSKFYPNINHEILKQLLRKKFKDKQLLNLLDIIIDSYPGEKGIPIGSYLSQYFANFYLAYFDHYLKEVLHIKYCVRFMDDLIILADSKEKLHSWYKDINMYLTTNLELSIKPNYQIFKTDDRGVDFVGYRFFHGYILLRKKTAKRIKAKALKIREKTKRGDLMRFSEFCTIFSNYGWLKWCDSHRFFMKYLQPIMPAAFKYYAWVIKKRKGMESYFMMKFYRKRRIAW